MDIAMKFRFPWHLAMPKVLSKTYKTNITQGKFKKFSKIKKRISNQRVR